MRKMIEENSPLLQAENNLFKKIWIESKKLWKVGGPAIFSRVALFSMTVITQSFAGHLGSLDLTAISIATTVILTISFGFLLGMASALETLCGQAYGARQYHMLGIYLQRSWVVLFLCSILLLPIYIFATPILLLIGQSPQVAEKSGEVVLWIIPLHFSFAFQFPLQRFLQSQLKTVVVAWVSGVALLFHVILSWFFVYWLKVGLIGTAIILDFSWWVSVLGLFFYTVCGGCPASWTGFSAEAFSGLWEFLKLALASGIMLCLENWYYRILIVAAGILNSGDVAVDALSICMSIFGWVSMIYLGSFAATGVRVANELGAGKGETAKFATKVSVATSLVLGLIISATVMVFRNHFTQIFTSVPVVVNAVNKLAILLALTILLNCIQPVLSGVAVGSGWQAGVAFINLGSYYIVGVPLGILIGWGFHYGIEGLWLGMISGTVVQTLILAFITLRLDWGNELGLASALETLCGQAFGAKQYNMLGVYLQRSWIIMLLFTYLLLPLYIFATPLLKLIGQPDDVAQLSGRVALLLIPLQLAFTLYFPLQRFLQSQLKTAVIAWVSLVALLFHIIASYVIIYTFGLGLYGAVITLDLSWWISTIGVLAYATCGQCPLTWKGFSFEAFSGLWEYFKLSIASGIMLCLENWYYRILLLLTGFLKNTKIAVDALSVCQNINSWELMIPLAFFAATGVRVANELGAGNGKGAKFATIVSAMTSFIIGLVFWVIIVIFRDKIALIFTSSSDVIRAVDDLVILLAFTLLLNSVQPVLSGVAVGSGWQAFVAFINLGCYYVIGLPVGVLFGIYFNLGAKGIWAGMIGGTAFQTLILAIIVVRSDWEKEADKARSRMQRLGDSNRK